MNQVLGTVETKKVLADITQIVCDGIDIAKNGANIFKSFGAIADIMKDVKDLVVAIPAAFPEIKDLSAEEIADLGTCAFAAFQSIFSEIKK